MEENAQEATRKATQFQLKYQNIPYQNQNFISISRKNIVPMWYIFCCKKNERFAIIGVCSSESALEN